MPSLSPRSEGGDYRGTFKCQSLGAGACRQGNHATSHKRRNHASARWQGWRKCLPTVRAMRSSTEAWRRGQHARSPSIALLTSNSKSALRFCPIPALTIHRVRGAPSKNLQGHSFNGCVGTWRALLRIDGDGDKRRGAQEGDRHSHCNNKAAKRGLNGARSEPRPKGARMAPKRGRAARERRETCATRAAPQERRASSAHAAP